MKPDIRDVENAFFAAMAAGWAQQKIEKIKVPDFPGSKAIPFVHGDFRVLDCYLVTPHSDMSTGWTVIWHLDQPVWTMYYGGKYAKIAIPFLKQCLRRAYVDECCFFGGRGPLFVRDDRFTYINQPQRNDFSHFAGEERVFDLNGQQLGYHWYRGMSLID